MSEMVTVRFKERYRGICANERARYRPHKAEELVEQGFCEIVSDDDAEAPRPARRPGREMVEVHALRPFGGLIVGEQALVTADHAARLVSQGSAMLALPPKEIAKPETPTVDKQSRPRAKRSTRRVKAPASDEE